VRPQLKEVLAAALFAATLAGCHPGTLVEGVANDSARRQADAGMGVRITAITAVVGPQGGKIATDTDALVLEFPEDALSNETTITATPSDNFPPSDRLVQDSAVDFEPDGLVFEKPVTLHLAYAPAQIPPGVNESDLRLFKVVDGRWQAVPGSTVDTGTHIVFAELTGFSTYGIRGLGSADDSHDAGAADMIVGDSNNVDAANVQDAMTAAACDGGACGEDAALDVGLLDCDDQLDCTADVQVGARCEWRLKNGFCLIKGSCFDAGAAATTNPCRICDPARSNSTFSDAEDDTSCEACTKGSCTPGRCLGGLCEKIY